jgi:hypothetical protein
VWFDPTDVAWGAEVIARPEATRLLTRLGATVSWRRGGPGEERGEGEIWVVLLGPDGDRAPDGLVALGATRTLSAVARAVWVRVPNVRAAVGVPPGPLLLMARPAERLAVGVAIGRVIAHEVVHALVPWLPHGTGLMSSRLTGRQLTGKSPSFDAEVTLAFQAALRGGPVPPPPGPGIVCLRPGGDPLKARALFHSRIDRHRLARREVRRIG